MLIVLCCGNSLRKYRDIHNGFVVCGLGIARHDGIQWNYDFDPYDYPLPGSRDQFVQRTRKYLECGWSSLPG